MERNLTPTEARSGAMSGRVALVLISSVAGAIIGLGVAWALFIPA